MEISNLHTFYTKLKFKILVFNFVHNTIKQTVPHCLIVKINNIEYAYQFL